MCEYWLAKELASSGLVSNSNLDTSITNSSLGARVTTLENNQQSITSLSLVPVIINFSYSSTITLQPSQVLNAIIIMTNIPPFGTSILSIPSIASLIAYDSNPIIGRGYYVTLTNNSGQNDSALEFSFGTGYTVIGSAIVGGGYSGRFYFAYTNVTSGQQAMAIYRVS
jgi:hypothetical protein